MANKAVGKSYLARFIRKLQLQLEWLIANWNENSKTISGNHVEENPDISELTEKLLLTLAYRVEEAGGKFILMAVLNQRKIYLGYCWQ